MTKPSWQDFGTHDESACPELWDGVIGAWAPFLGPTGLRQHDLSRSMVWQTASALPTYSVLDGAYAIDGPATISAPTPANYLGLTNATMICWVRKALQGSRVSCAGLTGPNTSRFGMVWDTDGTLYFTYEGEGENGYSITSLPGAGRRVIGGQYSFRKSAARTWVDGVFRNAKTFPDGTVPSSLRTTASTSSLTTIGNASTSAGGAVYGMVFWDRCLSDTEMQEIGQRGLHIMFERRRRSRIYLPQAGFQAAWARGSNVLLGFNQP